MQGRAIPVDADEYSETFKSVMSPFYDLATRHRNGVEAFTSILSFAKENGIALRFGSELYPTILSSDIIWQECFAPKGPNYGAASDILRIEILDREGGCYFDTDIIPKKPLGTLSAPKGLLAQAETTSFSNCILASTRTHEILARYREDVRKRYRASYRDHKLMQTYLDPKNTRGVTIAWSGPTALNNAIMALCDSDFFECAFPNDKRVQVTYENTWLEKPKKEAQKESV